MLEVDLEVVSALGRVREELVAAVVQGLRVTAEVTYPPVADETLDIPGGLNGAAESNGLAARNSQLEAPSVDLSTSAVEQQRMVDIVRRNNTY